MPNHPFRSLSIQRSSPLRLLPEGRQFKPFAYLSDTQHANFRFAALAGNQLHYWCTVMSVPACVVKPLYIATVGWSPLASEGGTTTLN